MSSKESSDPIHNEKRSRKTKSQSSVAKEEERQKQESLKIKIPTKKDTNVAATAPSASQASQGTSSSSQKPISQDSVKQLLASADINFTNMAQLLTFSKPLAFPEDVSMEYINKGIEGSDKKSWNMRDALLLKNEIEQHLGRARILKQSYTQKMIEQDLQAQSKIEAQQQQAAATAAAIVAAKTTSEQSLDQLTNLLTSLKPVPATPTVPAPTPSVPVSAPPVVAAAASSSSASSSSAPPPQTAILPGTSEPKIIRVAKPKRITDFFPQAEVPPAEVQTPPVIRTDSQQPDAMVIEASPPKTAEEKPVSTKRTKKREKQRKQKKRKRTVVDDDEDDEYEPAEVLEEEDEEIEEENSEEVDEEEATPAPTETIPVLEAPPVSSPTAPSTPKVTKKYGKRKTTLSQTPPVIAEPPGSPVATPQPRKKTQNKKMTTSAQARRRRKRTDITTDSDDQMADEVEERPKGGEKTPNELFWAFVNSYFTPTTVSNKRIMSLLDPEQIDETKDEAFKLPPLGRHYIEQWSEEDARAANFEDSIFDGAPSSGNNMFSPGTTNGILSPFPRKKKEAEEPEDVEMLKSALDIDLATENIDSSNISQRLLSALIEENDLGAPAPLIPGLTTDVVFQGAQVASKAKKGRPKLVKTKVQDNITSLMHLLPGDDGSLQSDLSLLANEDYSSKTLSQVNDRILAQLKELGVLGREEPIDLEAREDDEICREIRRRQTELKTVLELTNTKKQEIVEAVKSHQEEEKEREKLDREYLDMRKMYLALNRKK